MESGVRESLEMSPLSLRGVKTGISSILWFCTTDKSIFSLNLNVGRGLFNVILGYTFALFLLT